MPHHFRGWTRRFKNRCFDGQPARTSSPRRGPYRLEILAGTFDGTAKTLSEMGWFDGKLAKRMT